MVNSRNAVSRVAFVVFGLLLTMVGAAPPGRTPVEVADVDATQVVGSGGEFLEGVYAVVLTECLWAGRMTFHDQKIMLTRQEWYSNWATLDGRLEDATPVRIKGEDLGEMRTKILFSVGTQKSDYNKARVRVLKEGFEERLLVASLRNP